MGVPGQILGHFKAKERFGNPAIPMKRLFGPTIKLCEEGIRVSRTLALAIRIAKRAQNNNLVSIPGLGTVNGITIATTSTKSSNKSPQNLEPS